MNTFIVFASMLICGIATLAVVVKAVSRLMTDRRLMSWVLAVLSVAYSLIYVGGTLRLMGILPWPKDVVEMLGKADMRQLNGKAGLDAEMISLIRDTTEVLKAGDVTPLFETSEALFVAVGGGLALLLFNAFLFAMVHYITPENKMRWIMRLLGVFLAGLGCVAIAGTIVTGVNIVLTFFGACCGALALPGWALGLTYKEICVIGNIYLEVGVCLWSALWFVGVCLRRAKIKGGLVNSVIAIAAAVYGLICIIGSVIAIGHYAMPLEPAYDLCYRELVSLSAQTGVSYEWINFVIFIFGFLAIFGFDIIAGMLLRVKEEEK